MNNQINMIQYQVQRNKGQFSSYHFLDTSRVRACQCWLHQDVLLKTMQFVVPTALRLPNLYKRARRNYEDIDMLEREST